MNKSKFYAIYNGQCYVKGGGRKLYKKGVRLYAVEDHNGRIVIEQITLSMTKALTNCLAFVNGTKIEFDAVLTGEHLTYISNVRATV